MDSTVSPPDLDTASASTPALVWWRRPLVIASIALLLAGALGYALSKRSSSPTANGSAAVGTEVTNAIEAAIQKADSAPARSALVYRTILPSLVFISTDQRRDRNDSSDSAANDSAANDSAANEPSSNGKKRRRSDPDSLGGLGTGVVVSAEGAILTAYHVIAGADSIEVTFSDGTTSKAEVVSESRENDTAVLSTERKPEVIVPAVLGGGGQVGDEVYAVGHPLGLVGSMSAGVISGLGRAIPLDDELTLEGLIQFDAAVNPGNSGGPLLNRNGQVIGIVTALANPTDQNFFVGIGFAVPIETAGAGANGPGTGIQR
jgi:S1-C subfamily serine protease